MQRRRDVPRARLQGKRAAAHETRRDEMQQRDDEGTMERAHARSQQRLASFPLWQGASTTRWARTRARHHMSETRCQAKIEQSQAGNASSHEHQGSQIGRCSGAPVQIQLKVWCRVVRQCSCCPLVSSRVSLLRACAILARPTAGLASVRATIHAPSPTCLQCLPRFLGLQDNQETRRRREGKDRDIATHRVARTAYRIPHIARERSFIPSSSRCLA